MADTMGDSFGLAFAVVIHRLMEHENDPDIDEPYVPPAGNVLGASEEQSPSQPETETNECMTFPLISRAFHWMLSWFPV